jgi:hypothetical protein
VNDTKQLISVLESQGLQVVRGGSGHFRVFRDGRQIASMACSPNGGKRGLQNAVAQLRRAGVELPSKGTGRRQ